MRGGFTHRDSLGIKQVYGAEKRHKGKHTQWLTTGAGICHEEMWDIQPDEGGIDILQPSSQELYQLWLNVPSDQKMMPPRVNILGGEDETPTVVKSGGSKTETLVLAGTYDGMTSKAPCLSSISLFHVKMNAQSTWNYEIPASFRTAIIYVRTGSIVINGKRVPPQYTAYLGANGATLEVLSQDDGADFLLMAGEPLNEPVAAQGSMVMNSPEEINMAYSDYQAGRMGAPWSEKLSDEEWMKHVSQFPSAYKQTESAQ